MTTKYTPTKTISVSHVGNEDAEQAIGLKKEVRISPIAAQKNIQPPPLPACNTCAFSLANFGRIRSFLNHPSAMVNLYLRGWYCRFCFLLHDSETHGFRKFLHCISTQVSAIHVRIPHTSPPRGWGWGATLNGGLKAS